MLLFSSHDIFETGLLSTVLFLKITLEGSCFEDTMYKLTVGFFRLEIVRPIIAKTGLQ